MTIQAVKGLIYPDPTQYGNLAGGNAAYTSFLMDAAAEKVGGVFVVPKDGQLARIHFRTTTVTTGDTVRVSFQDVDTATGFPDGTADQFRTQVIADANDNVWFRSGLVTNDGSDTGTLRTVTRGQILSWVLDFNSFVAGNLNIAGKTAIISSGPFVGQHYFLHYTASWAKQQGFISVVALEYSDGSLEYIPGTFPIESATTINLNTGTTPDEIALRFRLPFTARIGGWWVVGNLGADTDIVLYGSDGTALETQAGDKDILQAVAGTNAVAGRFLSSHTVLADTWYRLAIRPSTGSTIVGLYAVVNSAALWDQMSGGQDMHYSERTDGLVWSNNTLRRPLIGLIIDGLDDGASGGGIPRSRFVNAGGL